MKMGAPGPVSEGMCPKIDSVLRITHWPDGVPEAFQRPSKSFGEPFQQALITDWGDSEAEAVVLKAVREYSERINDMVEQTVMLSLLRGECGVKVYWNGDRTVAVIDPEVPYMEIHWQYLSDPSLVHKLG